MVGWLEHCWEPFCVFSRYHWVTCEDRRISTVSSPQQQPSWAGLSCYCNFPEGFRADLLQEIVLWCCWETMIGSFHWDTAACFLWQEPYRSDPGSQSFTVGGTWLACPPRVLQVELRCFFVLLDHRTMSGLSGVTATSSGKTSPFFRSACISLSDAWCKMKGGGGSWQWFLPQEPFHLLFGSWQV